MALHQVFDKLFLAVINKLKFEFFRLATWTFGLDWISFLCSLLSDIDLAVDANDTGFAGCALLEI